MLKTSATQHKGFRQLIAGWVTTNIADSLLFIALAVWVKDLTGSDAAAGLTMVMMGIPAILAPFLGQLADRMSRKKILVWANIAMVVILASLFLVEQPSDVWIIHAVVFAYATMNYLTAAAQGGLIRDLLPDDALAQGNGLLSTIDQAFRLIGPLIGTGIYVAWGPQVIVAATMVFFLLSSPLIARVQVVETEPQKIEDASRYQELTAGFRHLFTTSPLGRATIFLAIAFGSTGLLNVAIYPMLEQGLNMPASMLGVLLPIQGVGAVLGGLVAARFIGKVGEMNTVIIGVALLTIGIVPPVVSANVYLVFAGIAVGGFGVILSVVGYATMRQKATPGYLQGRVSAAANVAINFPQLLGTILATAIITSVDFRWLIGSCVIVCGIALVSQVPGRLKA